MYKNLLLFIALFTSINFISQSANISGTIIDDATGLGIPFATIQVKGTDKGTTSDIDGKFSIEAESNQTIIVKMVGYVAQEMLIEGSGNFDINMKTKKNVMKVELITI